MPRRARSPNWDPNPNEYAGCAIAARSSTVWVAGDFSRIGGASREGPAALDAETGTALAWNPAPNGSVEAFALGPDSLYTAGSFNSVGGQRRRGLAEVDLVTSAPTSFGATTNLSVTVGGCCGLEKSVVLRLVDSILFVGAYGSFNGVRRNGLAALDAETGALLDWSPHFLGSRTGAASQVLGLGVGIRAENHRVDRVDEPHHACLERIVGGLGKGLP